MNKFNSLFFFFLRTSFAEREKSFRDSWCKRKTRVYFFQTSISYKQGENPLYRGGFFEKIGQDPYLLQKQKQKIR